MFESPRARQKQEIALAETLGLFVFAPASHNGCMASSKDYLTYVLDLLREVNGISFKKMMGEYLLYCDDILFGGIYDDRFLIKRTPSVECYGLKEEIPYPSAKAMLLIDIEDSQKIEEIVMAVCRDLS